MLKMGKLFLLLLSLLAVSTGLYAQKGNNPFELPNRIPLLKEKTLNNIDSITTDSLDEAPATNPTITPSNPFEVNTIKVPETPVNSTSKLGADNQNPFEIKKQTFTRTKKNKVKATKKKAILKAGPLSKKFKLWMTIIFVTLLTLLVNIYKSFLLKVYRSFLNDNFLKMIHRDYGTATMIPYLILYAFSLMLIGIFLFLVLNHYKFSFFSSPLLDLLASVGGVFGIFLIKHLVLQIISTIFPISKEIGQYSFTIIIFGIIVGLLLFPSILLILYAPSNLTVPLIYGTFAVVVLIYLYRILRSLFIGLKYISLHKFHFFVYLCTIEIAPLLILLKLATTS